MKFYPRSIVEVPAKNHNLPNIRILRLPLHSLLSIHIYFHIFHTHPCLTNLTKQLSPPYLPPRTWSSTPPFLFVIFTCTSLARTPPHPFMFSVLFTNTLLTHKSELPVSSFMSSTPSATHLPHPFILHLGDPLVSIAHHSNQEVDKEERHDGHEHQEEDLRGRQKGAR